MKFLISMFRMGFSLAVGFAASFSAAVIFFDYSGYKQISDRAFLVAIPTLAIAFLIFISFPKVFSWLAKRQVDALIWLAIPVVLVALVALLPYAISRVYYMGMFVFALVIFALILPVVPVIERLRSKYYIRYYFLGSLLSFVFVYGVISFFSSVFSSGFQIIIFTAFFTVLGNLFGYYFARHIFHSFQEGFLNNALNVLLVLTLPVFFIGVVKINLQFPAMFNIGYIKLPESWVETFFVASMIGSVWTIPLLEQFEERGIHASLKQTWMYAFVKENMPGLFAATMFSAINFVIARALNHPTFSLNSLFFRADSGLWLTILGYPEGGIVERSVHPLVLITLRPLVQFVGLFTAEKWFLAPLFVVAVMSGLCVLMAWLFVKRATQKNTYAFLFALLLGTTSAHLTFGSLVETYIFGVTSLIFFLLLVQAQEKRFSILVPAGLLVFGVTITNVAQAIIELFFTRFGFKRLIYYGTTLLAAGIILTTFVSILYPGNQSFFFVPADISFESRYTQPVYENSIEQITQKAAALGRTIFFYGIVAPRPIEDTILNGTASLTQLKTYNAHDQVYAWYSGFGYVPFAVWAFLLVGAFLYFFRNFRSSIHTPLMLGLLGSLIFNFFLHMNYGEEFFLYVTNWTYLLVFFVALAFADLAGRRWFQSALTVFLLLMMANNMWFLYTVMRALSVNFESL